MKILLYIRPNSDDFLTRLAKVIEPNCNVIKLCDFRGYGDIWCGNFLYQSDSYGIDIPKELLEDIRLRCRFLRKQKIELAYSLIRKYSRGIRDVFEKEKPELVLAQIPDNYCMDIIQRESLSRKITVINMVGEFIKGYSRLTLRGEYIHTRNASDEEAKNVLEFLLDKNYVANYAKNLGESHKQHRKIMARRKLIETFYYPIKKLIEKDKYNYHYNTMYYKGIKIKDVISDRIDNLFIELDELELNDEYIYVPLHVYPEATVDYYGPDPQCALYEDYMVDVLSNSDPNIKLLVKEHPAMYGARPSEFYYRLSQIRNVFLVNPYTNSNMILDRVKYVLTFSGSVGVEALIRRKVVYTLINNYYSDLSPNARKIERITDDLVKVEYEEYDNIVFMKALLEGLMDAQLGGQSTLSDSEIDKMGKIMRNYYYTRPVQEIYKR